MFILFIGLWLCATNRMGWVPCSVIPIFREQAEQLLSSSSLSAADLLAKALA